MLPATCLRCLKQWKHNLQIGEEKMTKKVFCCICIAVMMSMAFTPAVAEAVNAEAASMDITELALAAASFVFGFAVT